MLYILQYLSIIAAFSLPFTIGGTIRFAKSGSSKKLKLCIAGFAVSAVIVAITVIIAFVI